MKRIDEVIGTYNFREYHLSVQVLLLRSLKKWRETQRERDTHTHRERETESERDKERERETKREERRRDERLSNVN